MGSLAAIALLRFSLQAAGPVIATNGISNAGSHIPSTLPGGAIARGTRFFITGIHLDGTILNLTTPQTSVRLNLLSSTPNQLEALMPKAAPLGPVTLTVTARDGARGTAPLVIVGSNPQLYSRNGLGWGPGIIDNIEVGRRMKNDGSHAARPGQSIVLTTTGLGDASTATVHIGAAQAPVGNVRRNVKPGIDEIVATVPPDAPPGCFVPVRLRTHQATSHQATSSNTVTLAIGAPGGPCPQSAAFPLPHWKAGKSAVAVLARSISRQYGAPVDSTVDELTAAFFELKGSDSLKTPFALAPPSGTCILMTLATGEGVSQSLLSLLTGMPGEGLDAGPEIAVNNGRVQRRVAAMPGAPGLYQSKLSPGTVPRPGSRPLPLLLDAGPLQIRSRGGSHIEAFTANVSGPPPFEWTNRDKLTTIDRSSPLALHWIGASPGRLMLIAATSISATAAATACYCIEKGGKGTFTIPPDLLAHMALSRQTPGQPPARITLISWPERLENPIRAAGLLNGEALTVYGYMAGVLFR